MFQNKTLRELTLVAGLWLMASAAQAAPQPGPSMPIGAEAMAPRGYIDFCRRKPADCGADAGLVLAQADQADGRWRTLIALAEPGQAPQPIQPAALTTAPAPSPAAPQAEVAPAILLSAVTVLGARRSADADLGDAAVQTEASFQVPVMTRELRTLIAGINRKVNESIVGQVDEVTYGVADYWNTPLEDGRRFGDCEDYVLEKQRALIAAGIPREAVNIALVRTAHGENHAVLLVATSEGEIVLDNLTPWVSPWKDAPYFWVKREVNGEAFNWAMIDDPATPKDDLSARILIAFNR